MLSNQSLLYDQGQRGLMLTSLALLPGGWLMASAVNAGMFRISPEGQWFRMEPALPEGAYVNSLDTDGGILYASTTKGLYVLGEEGWTSTKITVPCHRVRGKGGILYAATDSGLWYRFNESWVRTSYIQSPIYDLFQTPQMIFMAGEKGISVFDRYTQTMDEHVLNTPVSSLCALNGSLLGASGGGDLMVGDRKGHFILMRFGRTKIFSLVASGGQVYACTDRGLYRIMPWKEQYHLCSVRLGTPVTDVAFSSGKLHLATYFGGVCTVNRQEDEEG